MTSHRAVSLACVALAALSLPVIAAQRPDNAGPPVAAAQRPGYPGPPAPPPGASDAPALRLIDRDTVWSGTVGVNGKLQIVKGATLTIQPGTTVQFMLPSTRVDASEDRIFVQPGGRLLARGTPSQPIVFLSATPGAQWFGIELHSGHGEDVLEHCRIQDSRTGLTCVGSSPSVGRCVFKGNGSGVSLWRQAKPAIRDSVFVDNEVAIKVGMQSAPTVASCEITGSSVSGIAIEQDSGGVVERSLLRGNKAGVAKRGSGSLVIANNRFEDNEIGASVDREGEAELRENVFTNNRLGVRGTAKASLLLSRNTFDANDTAVRFDGRAKGTVGGNDFTANTLGVHLSRTSGPEISGNRFLKNGTAVLCEYSSYPTISRNNFGDNGTDIRAGDNQSFEWTRTVWPAGDWERWADTYGRDKILARNNYWGERTSREMQAGGKAIGTLFDHHQSPEIIADNRPYRRDEIDYRPFSPEPFADAGVDARPEVGSPP